MPLLIVIALGVLFAVLLVQNNAKQNNLRATVEDLLAREAKRGIGGVILDQVSKDQLPLASSLSDQVGTRNISLLKFNGMRDLRTKNGHQIHLFAICGPGRGRSIHAAYANDKGDVEAVEILTSTALLQDPKLFKMRQSVLRSLTVRETRRFLDWLDEARKKPANPWIMKHVAAWARREAQGAEVRIDISEDTDISVFSSKTQDLLNSCGPIGPMMELEAYLDHRTDNDLQVAFEDVLLTFGDIARAIEFFGANTAPRRGEEA
jgi:hypothetical protein